MDIDELIKILKDELMKVLGDSYAEYKNETEKDIEAFLEVSKVKLERWTSLLIATELTEKDFQWLMESQRDLLLLNALNQAGVSKLRLGHLKNKIIGVIVNTAIAVVLKK